MDRKEKYLDDLKNPDPGIRKQATQELWQLWYREAGGAAEERLKKGLRLMDRKRWAEAEKLFSGLVSDYPDFPEGHNKLATLLFLRNQYIESVAECEVALKMNPHHFGAWNGLGMCFHHPGRFDRAIPSFERALNIQPYADINRVYIERCRRKLN